MVPESFRFRPKRKRRERERDGGAVARDPRVRFGRRERGKKEEGGGEKESRRIVFVIKLTRMGLINLCESIKQVL